MLEKPENLCFIQHYFTFSVFACIIADNLSVRIRHKTVVVEFTVYKNYYLNNEYSKYNYEPLNYTIENETSKVTYSLSF